MATLSNVQKNKNIYVETLLHAPSKNNVMNIYGSLMGIFDEKNKNIYVETLLHAPAQPRKGLFMDIQKINS